MQKLTHSLTARVSLLGRVAVFHLFFKICMSAPQLVASRNHGQAVTRGDHLGVLRRTLLGRSGRAAPTPLRLSRPRRRPQYRPRAEGRSGRPRRRLRASIGPSRNCMGIATCRLAYVAIWVFSTLTRYSIPSKVTAIATLQLTSGGSKAGRVLVRRPPAAAARHRQRRAGPSRVGSCQRPAAAALGVPALCHRLPRPTLLLTRQRSRDDQ